MDIFKVILLGVIQGLTEFLPVSSSGHLEIIQAFLKKPTESTSNLFMTVCLHSATVLSTLVYFRKDIFNLLQGLFQFKNNESFQFSFKIALSMLPAIFVGLLLEKQIEFLFTSNLLFIGLMLLITALLLFLSDYTTEKKQEISLSSAIIIGVAQTLAILPGISRSGATICVSLLLGIKKIEAIKFSFIMVIPLIIGSVAKFIIDNKFTLDDVNLLNLSIGFIAAFLTGLLACKWMIALVKNSKLIYFSFYCLILGLGIITFSFL